MLKDGQVIILYKEILWRKVFPPTETHSYPLVHFLKIVEEAT